MVKYLIRAIKIIYSIKKSWLFITLFSRILSGLIPVTELWVLSQLINNVTIYITGDEGSIYSILKLIGIQFCLMIIKSIISNYLNLLNIIIQQDLSYNLGRLIMNKQNNVPYYYYEIPSFYDYQYRIQNNYDGRFLRPITNIFDIIESLTSIVSYITFLFFMHWSLIFIGVLVAIPTFIIQFIYGKSKFDFFRDQAGKLREGNYIQALFTDKQSAKEIRLFNLKSYFMGNWQKIILNFNREYVNITRKQNIFNVGTDTFSGIIYAVSAFIIVYVIKIKKMSIGNFVTAIQSMNQLQSSISHTSFLFADILESMLYVKDFFEFIDYGKNDKTIVQKDIDSGSKINSQIFEKGVSIKNLSYKYPMSEKFALKAISLDIKAGEKIAIVGDNGSGKSTLIKLLMGLYQPTEGKLYFANTDSNKIPDESIRNNITVIFQDFVQYAYSVKENIAFSDISNINNDKEIIKVAEASGVDKLVEKLPKGYNTNLGKVLPGSIDISGGEWQKIALSRALFKKSKIIILDEPTASLDPKSELSIYNKFIELVKGKTAIFISHRMASAKMADRIIVMKNGGIIEEGTHKYLMEKRGEYHNMYESQSKWYE